MPNDESRTLSKPPPGVITVVIPTFNRRPRLQIAIESVLQETRIPLVVHVFDNASTDDTEAWVGQIAALDSRVVYSRNENNIGSERNYVRALGSVESTYFIPLADDDWLLPDFLFDAYKVLEAAPGLGAAIFIAEGRTDAGVVQTTYPAELNKIRFGTLGPVDHLRNWMTYGHYLWSAILWRKTVLNFVGFPYLHTGLSSDVDFQLQVFRRFPVYVADQRGAVYAMHEEQASQGYDITHVPGWAKFIHRMDAALGAGELFDPAEYSRLRALVISRYKGMWNRPPSTPPTYRRSIRLAAVAGVRLNDWRLAYSLTIREPIVRTLKRVGLVKFK